MIPYLFVIVPFRTNFRFLLSSSSRILLFILQNCSLSFILMHRLNMPTGAKLPLYAYMSSNKVKSSDKNKFSSTTTFFSLPPSTLPMRYSICSFSIFLKSLNELGLLLIRKVSQTNEKKDISCCSSR